jgi:hypothetical protein
MEFPAQTNALPSHNEIPRPTAVQSKVNVSPAQAHPVLGGKEKFCMANKTTVDNITAPLIE